MKASFQHLGFDTQNKSVITYWVQAPSFGFHWHYHPEYEICYVHKGQGTRLVGDHVSNFQEGDLVLVGSNLPHTWISDDEYNAKEEDMEVIVVQFSPTLLEDSLTKIPEFQPISQLLQTSQRGIHFPQSSASPIVSSLQRLMKLQDFLAVHELLHIFHLMVNTSDFSLLASPLYIPTLGKEHEDRIGKVCTYIHGNYVNPIKLEQVADIAHLSPTAFCRFFKKFTGKSLMEYVHDLRISKACNLLIEGDMNIADISYLSGFSSITHFNRSFLKHKACTPREYRKQFRK